MPGASLTHDEYAWPDHVHPKLYGNAVGGVVDDCRACLRCHLEAGYAMGFLEGTRSDERHDTHEAPADRGCRWCQAMPGEFCEEDCGGPSPVLHPDCDGEAGYAMGFLGGTRAREERTT